MRQFRDWCLRIGRQQFEAQRTSRSEQIGEPTEIAKVNERLYVMRNQVMHGACAKDSKLNRRPLREAGNLLVELVHSMLEIMIAHGIEEDWGEVCYPPEGPKSI